MRSHSDDWSDSPRRPRSRKPLRTILSIVQVLALAAATFFLLPMLVRAQEPPPFGDGSVLHCEFTGQVAYPGDTVYCRFRIGTNTNLDATFYVFVDEDSIRVLDKFDNEIDKTDPRHKTFLEFWRFSSFTRPVITRSIPEDHDVTYDPRQIEICAPKLLTSYDAGPNADGNTDTTKMCNLGVIRGIASSRNFTDDQQPAYERQYLFAMTELDQGDQTDYAGWGLEFDLIVRAVIPLDPDPCPSSRTNGICTTPVYERP